MQWRRTRLSLLFVMLSMCSCMIILSIVGTLAPAESTLAIPLNAMVGVFDDASRNLSVLADDLSEVQTLRERNRELEAAWAAAQAELVELREYRADYNRLSELLNYDAPARNQVTIAADVIQSYDPSSVVRTITINRGRRDGISEGMAVVTDQGMVGRIIDAAAQVSRVLLVTDPSSSINGRLQESREPGNVVGLLTGGLRMRDIPLDAEVSEGELVVTSGLGGNLPPDIPIGLVTSRRQFEFEISQEAEVRSLIDFESLEIVLIVTNFEPIDLTVFDDDEEDS